MSYRIVARAVDLAPRMFTLKKLGEAFFVRRHAERDDEEVLANALVFHEEEQREKRAPDGPFPDWARDWCKAETFSLGSNGLVFLSLVATVGERAVPSAGKGKVVGHLAYLDSVRVSILEEWRGQGIGAALTQVFMDWAKRSGVARVRMPLVVEQANAPAISLYERAGFKKTLSFEAGGVAYFQMVRFPSKQERYGVHLEEGTKERRTLERALRYSRLASQGSKTKRRKYASRARRYEAQVKEMTA